MLRQLRYFQSVVRNNSFSEAAEGHISQSAISQQIQALERDLGFQLLERKNRKFTLTPAGEHFYKKSLILVADDDGDENVYFLNLVDEADLLALMDEDEAAEYTSTDGVTNTDEDFADTSTVSDTEDAEDTDDADAEADESTDTENEEKSSSNMLPLVFVVLLVVGGAGAYFFMQTKKKQKSEERPDPDADYRDDDDEYVLPEDEELGSDSED